MIQLSFLHAIVRVVVRLIVRSGRARAAARIALSVLVPTSAGFAGAPCRAQEAAVPIVVTATRTEQPLSAALPSVTVITREDIDLSQSRDLSELLERQVGVEFARSGGQGSQTSLFLRGANSNQVLVLVDGVRINSALDGAANLGGFSTDTIERIEIVRGNLSSLYGSEAIGGVVQIFTRAGAHPGASALVEAGQGRTRDANASVAAPIGGALLSISAGARSQQAIPAIDIAQVPYINPALDANHNRSGAVRLDDRGEEGSFSAWAWGSRNDTDWDDPFNFSSVIPTDQITQVEHRAQDGFGLAGDRRFGDSTVRASAAQTRDDSVNLSNVPNTDPYTDADNSQFRSRNQQVQLQDATRLAAGIDLQGGLEEEVQDGAFTSHDYTTGTDSLNSSSRRIDSLWLGTTGSRANQQWQLNLRRDRYSDVGSATTGLAGWGWSILPGLKFTAQASTAFRAPSFEELYYPGYGNPALLPERARSEELGLRWAQDSVSASMALFRNRTSDLIVDLAPSYRAVNVARAALDGGELQAAAALRGLHLDASLSVDRPRDLDTGLPLLRRAHYSAKISSSYEIGDWNAGASLQRTGARDDIGVLSGEPVQLAPYTLARAAFSYRVIPAVRLQLRVENLFNAHYELIDGYNTLPRLVIAGVEARM